jgi:ABC-type multidrug transport system fused ATPase/permease subunit
VQSFEAQDEPTTAESAEDEININIFENISSTISEGGLNLSQGQRQLLCLARAIVSRPKIMVLDEATSAVDMVTDRLIQRSIREEFKDSTLIVIAHRLSTIADFDKVLVLSEGKMDEFGSPRALLEKKGTFHNMIVESGDKELLESMILGESEDRSLLDERDSPESVNKGKGRQTKT